jgi:FkbM family methyltransferase
MRTSRHSSGVAIGSAFRRSSGRLIEWLTAKAGTFGLHRLYHQPAKAGTFGTLWKLYRLYHRLFRHPLNADAPWNALKRFLIWQIAGRGARISMIAPYVDDTKLVVATGMSAAILTMYIGLVEFEDMSFVLHLLTDEDLFGDVGANVGVYCVLASGVRGAKSVVMEPVATTIEALRLNIAINELGGLVDILEIGGGAEPGELDFSTGEDGSNHVVQDGSGCPVAVLPLDEVFAARTPILLKIDVEGFETNVIKGAQRLLKDTALKAVLMEMNGAGRRYGFDERALDSEMRRLGFNSFLYDPWSRKLNPSNPKFLLNTLYVRDIAFVEHRLREAKPFQVLRHRI